MINKKIRITPKLKAAALEYKEKLEKMVSSLNSVAQDLIPELEKKYNVQCKSHRGRPDNIQLYGNRISGGYELYAIGDDAENDIKNASIELGDVLNVELNGLDVDATLKEEHPITWADAAVKFSVKPIPPSDDVNEALKVIASKERDKMEKELKRQSRYMLSGYDESTRWVVLN